MSTVISTIQKKISHLFSGLMLLTCLFCGLTPPSFGVEESITLQLRWRHQFQFAGFYAAQAKGFYKQVGLNVKFVESTPETNVVQEVLSHHAQYGIGSSALLLSRQQGQPVVALAAVFQHSPMVLLARQDAGINSVHDLVDKRIMLEPNAEELLAYLHHEGVSEHQLKILPHNFQEQDLIAGRIDAMSGYSIDEPYQLQQHNLNYLAFTPRASGIDFYGDVLFTSEQELDKYPARVQAFREASIKGWRYALDNPDEMIDWIRTHYPHHKSREQLQFEAANIQPFIRSNIVEIGYMNPGRWQHIAEIYTELGLIPDVPELDGFLYSQQSLQEQKQHRLYLIIAGTLAIATILIALLLLFLHMNRRLRQESQQRLALSLVLATNERHFRFITENSADVIWTMDVVNRRFTYVSPSISQLIGYSADEIKQKTLSELVTRESAGNVQTALDDALANWNNGDRTNTKRVSVIDLVHKNGHLVHCEVVTTLHADTDNQVAILGVARDISERKAAEEMMRNLAFYDSLTKLPNRRLLQDRLQQAISTAAREHSKLAVLFIDLDHFKPINDNYGHQIGDWLLQTAAKRMLNCVRQTDTIARQGGDEFVALLPSIRDQQHAVKVAEKIHARLNQSFEMSDGKSFRISCCIGIAIYPEHGLTQNQLLKSGDLAMYRAKELGRNRVEVFSPEAMEHGNHQISEIDNQLMRLNWKPGYECGNADIDGEHRQLFELANELLNSAMDQEHFSDEKFNISFTTLLQHIVRHFHNEEAILEQMHDPSLPAHHQEHQRLLTQASALHKTSREDEIWLSHLMDFVLQDVVMKHMLKYDRQYFHLFGPQSRPLKGEDQEP